MLRYSEASTLIDPDPSEYLRMTMRWFVAICVPVVFVASNAHAAAPNILFLIADDHSSFSLGCYGGNNRTPNLDKLAADGVRFTNAFVASPQCSPSRSAMLTGLSPHRTNTSRLHTPLRAGHLTIIERLKSAGYHTGGFKKHHLGPELRDKFDFYESSDN